MSQTIHYLFSICKCIEKNFENENLKSRTKASKRKKNQWHKKSKVRILHRNGYSQVSIKKNCK